MHIIPVIDIKDGQAVLARQGQRDSYRPLNTKICPHSGLQQTIEALLKIFPFSTLYLADLDAITQTGSNQQLIQQAIDTFPEIQFWLDNGTKIKTFLTHDDLPYTMVLGSESQSQDQIEQLAQIKEKFILSLDFFPDRGYTGPAKLLQQPELWSENIIIMNLERVGKNAGPDFAKLKYYAQRYADKKIIAAGGIRHKQDLVDLQNIGVDQVLLASALHSGKINSKIIKSITETQ